jgi:carbon-monoxide dehydrogenase large subunit
MDAVEVRRRNLIAGPFPFTTPTGATYDSGEYAGALDKALSCRRVRRAPGGAASPSRRGRGPAARHRRVDLRRGDQRPAQRRARLDRGASGRQSAGAHRIVGPRPGPPHRLRHDRVGADRYPDRGDHGAPRRHRRRGARRWHRRLEVAPGGRDGGAVSAADVLVDRARTVAADGLEAAPSRHRAGRRPGRVPRGRHFGPRSVGWAELATRVSELATGRSLRPM